MIIHVLLNSINSEYSGDLKVLTYVSVMNNEE